MQLSIRHVTHYAFGQPVAYGLQRLRLRPKSTQGQVVDEWNIALDGAKCEVEYEDQHHNHTVLASILPGAETVTITCTGLVDTSDHAGVIGRHSGHMPLWTFRRQTPLTRPGPAMRALANGIGAKDAPPLDVLHALSRAVLEAMTYEIGHTDSTTPAEESLTAGHGVCQDHAHVFIGCARLLGMPARYVSGYLMMNDRIDQEAGHAWAEAHVEELGWVGFDVSNSISPDARYVRVATGCDYNDAAPVTGMSWGAGESELSVSISVEQQLVEQ